MTRWLDIVDEALCELPPAAFSDVVAEAQCLIHDVLNGRAAPRDLLADPAGRRLPPPVSHSIERCVMMTESPNAQLLRLHLEMCVPLLIREFVSGQRPLTFPRPDLAEIIAAAGDAILYRVPGQTAGAVSALAEALATLAFCPGGVRFMELHFEAPPDQVRAALAANGLANPPARPVWFLPGDKTPPAVSPVAIPSFREVAQCLQPGSRRPPER